MYGAPFNRCVECEEIITNPICPDCLCVKMRVLVGEHSPKLAREIHGADIDGDTTCIKCGKGMGLCAHCYSKDIHDFLEQENPDIAREFASRFDFDLRQNVADFA